MTSPNFLTCPGVPELPTSPVPPSRSEAPPSPPPPTPVKPTRPRRIGRWIAAFCVLAVLVLAAPGIVAVTRAAVAAQNAKAAIARAEDAAGRLDFSSVHDELSTASRNLSTVRDALSASWVWQSLPWFGAQIRGVEDASAAGVATLDALSDLAGAFSDASGVLQSGAPLAGVAGGISPTTRYAELTRTQKEELLQKLAMALPALRLARDKIHLAQELWNRVPQNDLASPIRSALVPFADRLPVLAQSLDDVAPLLEIGVPLAGPDGPSRLFLLLQNADELRPAGGFIGTIGTVTFDGGDLAEFNFDDVYNVDRRVEGIWKEIPPAPIRDRLGVAAWYLRDSNWSPDFPTSADRALDFYLRESSLGGQPVATPPATVMALEPGFFSAILSLTGPVTVGGTVFTADNFFERLEFAVESDFKNQGIPVERRKEIVAQVGATVLDRLKQLPAYRWPELIHLVRTALDQKQVLIFSHDRDLEATLDARGWSGRARATNGDFAWVVDANLAALKTDGVMKKTVTYRLDATNPDHPTATVTLRYTNTAQKIDWRYTRYRSYTRVYVPDGSVLLSSSGALQEKNNSVDVFHELGKTVFGAFWSIEPGATGELSFTYALPPSAVEKISSGAYHLDWPKQPGADKTQLTLDLSFDKKVRSASPPEQSDKWGDARYEYTTDSLTDRTFDLTFD